jgi:hypothetical protein
MMPVTIANLGLIQDGSLVLAPQVTEKAMV